MAAASASKNHGIRSMLMNAKHGYNQKMQKYKKTNHTKNKHIPATLTFTSDIVLSNFFLSQNSSNM
jgi:hypothetical protein